MSEQADLETRGSLVRGYFVPVVDPQGERPVTVAELGAALRDRWRLIVLVTFACVTIGLAAAMLLPKRYEARVVLAPVTDSQSGSALGGLLAQFGGIASLAGFSVSGDDLQIEAYATLMSRAFTDEFIRENRLMPVLFDGRWDATRETWRPSWWREDPTSGDAFERFNEKIRFVTQDRQTGIVTLTIRWNNAQLAAEWANELVARVNHRLRERAINESRRNIEYLRLELDKTDVVAVRDSIARVMENEVRRAMLATARPDFAFRVIDPAVAAESHEFASPNRKLIVIGSLAAGLLLGLLIAISQHLFASERLRTT